MSGTYFNPLHRVFLNLSGGTVTGDTLFTQSVSAQTLYSGATNLYSIFAGIGSGGSASLNPTYVGYGNTSSGLTGNSNFTYSETLNVISSTLPAFNGYQSNSSSQPAGKLFKALNAGGQMWPVLQLNRGDGTTITPSAGVGASLSFGLPDGISVFTSSEDNVVIGGIYDIQATTAASSRNTAFVVQTQSGGTLANKLKVSYSGTTSYVPIKIENNLATQQVLFSIGDTLTYTDKYLNYVPGGLLDVSGLQFYNYLGQNHRIQSSIGYLEITSSNQLTFYQTPKTVFDGTVYVGQYNAPPSTYYFEVSGSSKFQGLTANTISANTAQITYVSANTLYVVGGNTNYSLRHGALLLGTDSTSSYLFRADQPDGGNAISKFATYFGGPAYPQMLGPNYANFGSTTIAVANNAAYLNAGRSVADRASLSIESGVTVTSNLSDGVIWNDGSHLYGSFGGQIRQLDHYLTSTQIAFGSSTNGISGSTSLSFSLQPAISRLLVGDSTHNGQIDFVSNASSYLRIEGGTSSYITQFLGGDIYVRNYLGEHSLVLQQNNVVRALNLSATSFTASSIMIDTSSISYGLDYYNLGTKRWSLNVDGNNYFRLHPWQAGNYGSNDIFFEGSAIGVGGIPTENLTVYGKTRTETLSATTITASTIIATYERANTLTATTFSAYTIQSDTLNGATERMVQADTGGTLYAAQEIVSGIVTDPTAITLLTTASNWNLAGVYTGTTITNTYQGQFYGDTGNTYVYLALADNYFARIPRV